MLQALQPLTLRRLRSEVGSPAGRHREIWMPLQATPLQKAAYCSVLVRSIDVLADPKPPRHAGHRAAQIRGVCAELRKVRSALLHVALCVLLCTPESRLLRHWTAAPFLAPQPLSPAPADPLLQLQLSQHAASRAADVAAHVCIALPSSASRRPEQDELQVCNHPHLLAEHEAAEDAASEAKLLEATCKLALLHQLLPLLQAAGRHVLLLSQSPAVRVCPCCRPSDTTCAVLCGHAELHLAQVHV